MQTAKNILYIGPYRQHDGWGLAGRDCLLSLLTTHHNISAVPVYLNYSAACSIDNKAILNAEKNNLDHYDIVMQMALPTALSYNGNFDKNIAIIFLENKKLFSDGILPLNTMDQILVSSQKEVECLKRSGVIAQSNSIMQPVDTDSIANFDSNKRQLQFNGKNANSYKFYFIGENIQRKNIRDMILAFSLEFDETDDVCFVLKTNIPGLSPAQASKQMEEQFSNLQKSLRTKKRFAPIVTVTERLSDDQLFGIHNICDCFVVASYGEAFCRPAAEALCFGNYLILSENIGIREMVDANDFGDVSAQDQPVVVKDYSYLGGLDMYNGEEIWSVPSILDLRKQMRFAFENKPKVDPAKYLTRFSYEQIGQNICRCIQ